MYSPTVFGCPDTSISPSRITSSPTEIIFVARATSSASGLSKLLLSRLLASATSAVPTREVNSRAIARGAQPDLVLDDPPRTAELAKRIEIPHDRHVGIGRVDLARSIRLDAARECRHSPQEEHLWAAPRRRETDIEARTLRDNAGLCEERIRPAPPVRPQRVH